MNLTVLADELKSVFRSTKGFKKAWVYQDRIVPVDFNLGGIRVAFNLVPLPDEQNPQQVSVQLFFRDKQSILQQRLTKRDGSGKLEIAVLPVSASLAHDTHAVVVEAFETHDLLSFASRDSVDGREIVVHEVSAAPLAASQQPATEKAPFTISDVVARDICIGCGACAVATDGAIGISVNDKGMQCASQADIQALDEASFAKADRVCPFSDNAANEDELAAPRSDETPMPINQSLGRYLAVLAGRENDDARLVGSSSGGITSWLLKQLLESKRVDGVIHVGGTGDDARLFAYRLSFSAADLDKHRKSIYYSTSLVDVLQEAKRHTDKTFAVVGVPCFIKSARLLAKEDESIARCLKYFVGIVCGHMKSSFFAEANAWQMGIAPDDVKQVDFRVKIPGRKSSQYQFEAVPRSGEDVERRQPNKMLGGSWGHGFFQPNACNFCDDVFAETADVAFGDAWLPKYRDDWRGTNVIVARNKEIVDILQEGANTEALNIENITVADIVKSQAGGLRHRRGGLSVRLQDDIEAGKNVPQKRVEPGYEGIPDWRVDLIRQRRKLSARSFETFKAAKESGDISRFLDPMSREVAIYKYLETHKYPPAKTADRPYDVALFGWHHQGNLGGVLTFFALHQLLEKMGYKVLVVWRPSRTKIQAGNRNNHAILSQYYTYSEQLPPERLHELRNLCDTFVLASDQLWAGKWVPFNPEYEFLGAGDDSVKKISVATSLGGDGSSFPVKGERGAVVEHLIRQIDHISVREPSAVGLIEGIGAKATQILDPVFLCPPSTYADLAARAKLQLGEEEYVFGYILDAQEPVVKFGRDVVTRERGVEQSLFTTTMQNAKAKEEKTALWESFGGLTFLPEADVADFLAVVSRANFVFTDSFHGACMATIYNRPFICCPASSRGHSRFELFDKLGLRDRICERDALSAEIINQPIDWEEVNKRLDAMRAESFAWLSNAFGRDFGTIMAEFEGG